MGISLKNVYYTYQEGSPFEGQALSDISLEIKDRSYTAIVGHTGSGKSTLLQLLNGLLCPTQGEIGSKKDEALEEKSGVGLSIPRKSTICRDSFS